MDTRPSPVLNEKPPFEDLYRQYWSGMLFYCIRKTGDRENAEDLVSDTFLYCFDHYDSFDPGKSAVSTWLYMVLNSRIKNYYRDRRESVDLTTLENLLSADGDDIVWTGGRGSGWSDADNWARTLKSSALCWRIRLS